MRTVIPAVATAAIALGAVFAFPLTADAASDVRVLDNIDCVGHPRKIAIQNFGDSAQDLTGWKLLSDKPNEEFDLSIAGTIAPGGAFFVFNGHKSPPVPEQSGGLWIYPWNYTENLVESAFVLNEDGTDFIRLVDASEFPWREVHAMPCPRTTEIPPLQQPQTPTPAPGNPGPGTQDPGQTDANQAAATQTEDTQSGGASQNQPAGNTAAAGGASGSTGQTGPAGAGAVGGPSSGIGSLLPGSAGPSLTAHPLPLSLLGVIAGAALALVGLRMLRRVLRCTTLPPLETRDTRATPPES